VASPARRDANQRNAQQSTGPRTAEGKARSAANALRHGVLAERAIVLPHEDLHDYEALVDTLRNDLDPVGSLEEWLAEQIAALAWRLRRCAYAEAGIYTSYLASEAVTLATRRANLATRRVGGLLGPHGHPDHCPRAAHSATRMTRVADGMGVGSFL
jgi:hypothetical protein